MGTNISKYCQLNSFLLLEYEFNKDAVNTTLVSPKVAYTEFGTKYFYEGNAALGNSNNILPLNSIPINVQRTSWYLDASSYDITYPIYWDSSVNISTTIYPYDTIKIHVVSGYNFDDIGGFLLQVRANDTSANLVDLANFTYAKQSQTLGSNVVKFATNTLYLGNRFYDKYIEFKIPSIQELGGDIATHLGTILNIASLSDVYITYSTIFDIINNNYLIDEIINLQLPVESVADNFNCFIGESTAGDFIEYYATWNNLIIGNYIGDIESGVIKLYTSNNPNDNYQSFIDTYGMNSRKWIIIHEISVYEQLAGPGGTSLLTQKFAFTQDSNFDQVNYFRPILKNSDIDVSYIIQYTCRLTNRMDGTQIIRKASFSSSDPKKYGLWFTRLTVENLIPYKIFNKIEAEKPNINIESRLEKIKYVKVFYDTTRIMLNEFNEIFPQGTGPLFLKSLDSNYKFKFERLDNNGNRVNVDLSGAYNYALVFKLDDGTKIEKNATYNQDNMNTVLGELEFKLYESELFKLKSQSNNNYSIVVKNPDQTSYTLYEGLFYSLSDEKEVIGNYNSLFTVTDLQSKVAELETQVKALTDENAVLKTK